MKKRIIYNLFVSGLPRLAALLACAVFAVCCDDFVEVEQPNSQLTGTAVFENKTTATAAMKDIYAKMRDMGLLTGKSLGISTLLGVYTDELVSYENGNYTSEPFYNNALAAPNGSVQEIWARTYSQVYAANAVIEGVTASPGIEPDDKNRLIGEALFTRALLHSYLAGIFGACPYITTTDYRQNATVRRTPAAAVFNLCIADLERAQLLLPEAYAGTERVRPNKFAATALLARLYLYAERWPEAANAASAVINEGGFYIWETDLDKIFLKESTATIWQLSSGGGYANTQEGATFIFTAGPPQTVALRPEFYSTFEAGDQRRDHWTRMVTDGTDSWYHAYKYKQDISSSVPAEYSVMLRLAEQYLIRAEARARQGELTAAKDDLNKIRNTAGLGDTAATTAGEIIAAVINERRFELFTETGMRFFDLQRTGQLDAALSAIKPGWNSTDRLWPVPQSELLINPNLSPQNPGY
jgi:hypothetical protein